MVRIRLLPDALVSQIAAGEVVERPASVVKELVENALDAGASQVEVQLEAGGRGRIAVGDDGCGMGRDDALLAFDRHATSKIASFADLERVATLGFRGEALSSIAAVARLELTTAEQPGEGCRVLIEGGRVRAAEPCTRPRGTTLEVRSLFFNVPARRKFLKSQETELRRALEVVQGYALARPDVRFRLVHEDKTLLDALPASGAASQIAEQTTDQTAGGARERIGQIFGRDFAARLAAIPQAAGRDGERIGGFVGAPETARSRRQFVFVNRRLVRDRAVLAAFHRAVREEWKSEDIPALFLFLDLPPEEVDVNVHPQKAEVRFRDPGLLARLAAALRAGLERARGEVAAPLRSPAGEPAVPFAWQGLGGHGRFASGPEAGARGADLPIEVTEGPAPPWSVATPWNAPGGRFAAPSYLPPVRPAVPLSGRRGEARPFRLLGQYKATLILLEGPDGLYLIDQHVAHERILFERLRRALAAERVPLQHLLTPLLLDLAPAERLRLLELAPGLEGCGFTVAELSGGTLALTAVPAVLSAGEAEALLLALPADGADTDGAAVGDLRRRILDALAAGLACKAAVKMHHPLAVQEMEALVAELFAAEQPYACPHGRPIVLQMTDSDLERRFGRR
ncbi:MAG TPA: DNA mismatch repair endonuclease MutL [Thermoanaerobaculia bacterium]|nr:DNA mismatch repair endonuclease MutL [Thermoanaerobaculia bacterium]